MMTCLRWILHGIHEAGAKSASRETAVPAQRYALVVLHATIGLELRTNWAVNG